ncbi:hypothetical protein Asulf_01159 [Archaeoglobus sulfaticallidus PM70-1]|uniref:Uncharacterized protein n=1 Tax=Archaeoglobus sulfaticallidus PM70-1 TaxID=387631 RepID=N0BDS5_9EURY|nr:hypothetical protein [Archaeoglobus sulfaticallidus]AGK61158.1 hypothetical protein Asulf_01159 [Archaeoglobus sulfaticallidus PM70-1]
MEKKVEGWRSRKRVTIHITKRNLHEKLKSCFEYLHSLDTVVWTVLEQIYRQ